MYEEALKEFKSERKAAASLGLSRSQFSKKLQGERGLCQRLGTGCKNYPEPGLKGCRSCLDNCRDTRDKTKAKAVADRWKKNNPKKVRDSQRKSAIKWNAKNPNYQKEYAASEGGRKRLKAKNGNRKARKLKACPPWANREALKEFYANCPEGFEVDHIYPLMHSTCSGLHVIWNLQYLPAKANHAKANRLPEEWEAYQASIHPDHLAYLMKPGKYHKKDTA